MTFFDEKSSQTPEKSGATNPGAMASAELNSSAGHADIRTHLETSLRSMPTVPESPGQRSSGSATPPSTPASPGSATKSSPALPYTSELDPMEEGPPSLPGHGGEMVTPRGADESPPDDPFALNGDAPGTPQGMEYADLERSGVEGSPEMDRSCPAGLANALALEGGGYVSTVLEASVIGQNIPEPAAEAPDAEDLRRAEDSKMDISDPISDPDPELTDNGEREQDESNMPDVEDSPAKAAAVDVSDMPDAAPEAADEAAEAPVFAG